MKKFTKREEWLAWNQRQLLAALSDICTALARLAGDAGGPAKPAAQPRKSAGKSAVDRVCELFGLSSFERAILLLCAGAELESRYGELLARLNCKTGPTFALALAAFPDGHWSALSPSGPLRHWRLIEISAGDTLVNSRLRIAERALHYLCGVETLDEQLRGLVRPCAAPGPLTPAHADVATEITATWTGAKPQAVVQLFGASAPDRHAIAFAAADARGLRLHALRASDIPSVPQEREAVARLWEREAALANSVLLIETDDAEPAELARTSAFLNALHSIAITSGRGPIYELDTRSVSFEISRPSPAAQRALWVDALGASEAKTLNGEVEAVAQQFQLDVASIRQLAAQPATIRAGRALWEACRVRTRGPIESLAQRVDARASWKDLALPAKPLRALQEIAAHVRQRYRVYEAWGFAARQARGLGITALFSGPSGAGKTMAAEVLATDLHLDLFRIELSAVVNKYIGETEKNLRRVFDAAEAGGAILLFDEADALFGKRSEVRDSHDRYANIEVSYLLQRMESYRGLAILTTNMQQALDPAFLRRLRFVVNFPFPAAPQREEIWRKIFPAATPTEGLDPAKLARLNVVGGHIRNIALGAAIIAADSNEPVRMKHLLHAARSECAKLDRPLAEAELGGWA